MGEEDLEMLVNQVEGTLRGIRKVQHSVQDVESKLNELSQRIDSLFEEQRNIKVLLKSLEKKLNNRIDAVLEDINSGKAKVDGVQESIETSTSEIRKDVSDLRRDLHGSEERLTEAMERVRDEIIGHINDLEFKILRLDESIALIKALNTDTKSIIKAFTNEMRSAVSELSKDEHERAERLNRRIDDVEKSLLAELEMQERLLNLHTEKLAVLQGQLLDVRDYLTREMGFLSTKVGELEVFPPREVEKDE